MLYATCTTYTERGTSEDRLVSANHFPSALPDNAQALANVPGAAHFLLNTAMLYLQRFSKEDDVKS